MARIRTVRMHLPGIALGLATSVFVGSGAAATEPDLVPGESGPPEEIAMGIREVLEAAGPKVTLESGTSLEFWFRKEWPGGGSTGRQGATFSDIGIGALLGAVRIDGPWSDYKGNAIEPGTFTLRYGMRPEDGNHMGVSVHLDFVLLVPVVEDPDLEVGWTQDDLNIMSFAATGIGHPGVMSLAPNYEEPDEPAVFVDDAGGWAVSWKWEGGPVIGFVVEGEGEH